MSAYFLWAATVRETIMKENPECKMSEISKMLGNLWKKMIAKSKKKFTDKADKEMKEYKNKNTAHKSTAQYKKFAKDRKEWNENWKEESDQRKIDKAIEKENKKKQKKKNGKKNKNKK